MQTAQMNRWEQKNETKKKICGACLILFEAVLEVDEEDAVGVDCAEDDAVAQEAGEHDQPSLDKASESNEFSRLREKNCAQLKLEARLT
jgi:hypothetical protein